VRAFSRLSFILSSSFSLVWARTLDSGTQVFHLTMHKRLNINREGRGSAAGHNDENALVIPSIEVDVVRTATIFFPIQNLGESFPPSVTCSAQRVGQQLYQCFVNQVVLVAKNALAIFKVKGSLCFSGRATHHLARMLWRQSWVLEEGEN